MASRRLKSHETCPYREALTTLVGTSPPLWLRGNLGKFDEVEHDNLVDWIGRNLQPSMSWCTIHGVIDAVLELVREAKDNGNFKGTQYDLEYRTLREEAESTEAILGGAPAGWQHYTLSNPVATKDVGPKIGIDLAAGTMVFVQRKGSEVFIRATADGISYKIDALVYVEGLDPPSRKGTRPTL